MPDLSFINMETQAITSEIESMKRGGSYDQKKPHKLLMLLAVLDLISNGSITDNKIYLNNKLIESFEKFFRTYANEDDWCQPGPPFFHLRTSSFWKHKIRPGKEEEYSKLKNVGGGTSIINEYIEYSYLDDSSYKLFTNVNSRAIIQEFIQRQLFPQSMNKIPTNFHESFSLSRPAIMQIIKAIKLSQNKIDFNSKKTREIYFGEQTTLGKNYIKSMPSYAKGCGLINFDYRLTPFGEYVLLNDVHLELLGTQWLLHYFMCTPLGPGPSFWQDIVFKYFFSTNIFSIDELVETIGNFIWKTENKILEKRGVRSSATILLGTYLKPEGLNKLHLLESTESGRYRVCEPNHAPIWAIALAFVDFWDAQYPGRLGVGLDTLLESDFLKIFLIGKSDFMEVMEAMQEEGYVSIHRTAPPFQIVLLKQDQEGLLKKIYGSE